MPLPINPADWRYWGQWRQPTLHGEAWMHWAEAKVLRRFRPKPTSNLLLLDGHFYWWLADYDAVTKAGAEAIAQKDWRFFQQVTAAATQAKAAALAMERLIGQRIPHRQLISRFIAAFHELMGPWAAIFLVSPPLEAVLEQFSQERRLPLAELAALVQPKRKPWLAQEHLGSQELLKQLERRHLTRLLAMPAEQGLQRIERKYPPLAKAIAAHLRRYDWVGTHHFWGEGLTLDKLWERWRIQNRTLVQCSQGQLSGSTLPPLVRQCIHQLQALSFWRLHLAEVSDRLAFRFRPIFNFVERSLKLPADALYWMTSHELRQAMNGKRISRDDLILRKRRYGVLYHSGVEQLITGRAVNTALRKVQPTTPTDYQQITVLQGQIASPGLTKGRVRLVLDPEAVRVFRHGEVLVAPETTPDFVPAMEKAAAVVTDIGGITSHAAIICRELGKPCVIGTKIATKILKDGDLIEVDANQGIVKIIKKR